MRTLALLLVGCPKGSSDDSTPADTQPTETSCDPDTWAGWDIPLDPQGPLTQIHPSVAWDGEALWAAWARPDTEGVHFDIWAGRLSPEGDTLVQPLQLNNSGTNDGYPRVAVAGERVVVAWQADNMSGANNLDVLVRGFDRDGGAQDEAPTAVQPTIDGSPLTGDGWMPALAPGPSGGFLLAGAFAAPGAHAFQAVMQGLDASGASTGAGTLPALSAADSQVYPAVAVAPDGRRFMAWEAWPAQGDKLVQLSLDGGAPVSFGEGSDAGLPSVAVDGGGTAWLVWYEELGGEYDLQVRAGDLGGSPAAAVLGVPGRIEHTPMVVASDEGALVAWMRVISGYRAELVVQPVHLEDGAIVAGMEQTLGTETPVAPYLPGLTWLCDDVWFVVWVEGNSPDYVVKGRFVHAG